MHFGETQQKPREWIRQSFPQDERPRQPSEEVVQATVNKKGCREKELLEQRLKAEKTHHWEDCKLITGTHRSWTAGNRGFMPDKGFRKNTIQKTAYIARVTVWGRAWKGGNNESSRGVSWQNSVNANDPNSTPKCKVYS